MRSRLVWLIPIVGFVALGFVLFGRSEFEVPENFPVLDAAEIGTGSPSDEPEKATFGSGCFWCTEAVFQNIRGVAKVESGYSGGKTKNPTYEDICFGNSGHAEVVQVTFDPKLVSYPELLEVFWRSHDPTTPDRQGNDVGTQYRSVIFCHNERQKQLAERYKQKIDEAKVFNDPIVTEISPYTVFYKAEDEHQDYYAQNGRKPYCQAVIRPKMDKLKKVFADKWKAD